MYFSVMNNIMIRLKLLKFIHFLKEKAVGVNFSVIYHLSNIHIFKIRNLSILNFSLKKKTHKIKDCLFSCQMIFFYNL